MFNGIIFNQGIIKEILKRKKGINLFLNSNLKLKKKDLGMSIACDGVCLTLVSIKNKTLEFYLSNETIKRSKLKKIKKGDKINIELPVKYGQKISGHICQGHVDTVAVFNKKTKVDESYIYDFKINHNFKKLFVEKASILVNGVSLTISKITRKGFQIWIIPHTLKLTNLNNLNKGDLVNIEVDIFSKYVKKYFNEKS